MKFIVLFVLACVALAAAAPQFFAPYPGYLGTVGTFGPYGARTLVTGPTVVNGFTGWPNRFIAPGAIGTTFY